MILAGHLVLYSPAWGDNWFPRTWFTYDMADLGRPSVSRRAPDLAATQSNTLHPWLPYSRMSLSHHLLCWLCGGVGFCKGSSPFSGHLCHAGE